MGLFNKTDKPDTKEFVCYVLIDKELPNEPITFTSTRDEALMALDQYIYLKHYIHFRAWCNQRDLPVDHATSWNDYSKSVLAEEFNQSSEGSGYTVVRVSYAANIIASLLRSVNNCTPMGCPFDTDEELDSYSAYFAQKAQLVEQGKEKFTDVEEALDVLFSDLEALNKEVDDPVEEQFTPPHITLPNTKKKGSGRNKKSTRDTPNYDA